ncbi:hypothetical protein [Pseudofrankia inefficax]|uniref:Lipoprotein n=1 Tax=Pseudofrankia inefficax (strain DSM 45817 / CECT 9037 / DDB 130130 / EuI1c) TaxID=298654 RepID=E3JBJ0_PSEI1|nr:hypothetical protein [Pseudofrankia inefficax]ADP79862.1 hypothetical protein FraEuI1c_1806 [Pseudofrankia inefficax]
MVGALVALAATLALSAGCAGRPPGPPSPTVAGGVASVQADADVPADWVARVRADVAAAVGDVAGALPGGWARRVDVRLVASDDRLRAAAGWAGGGPTGTVAAVAVLPVPGPGLASSSPPGAGGGRLVVDLDVYRRLTAVGRRIVLRHELTHLATAAETPAGMPVWLVEGFAEEIGHEGVTGLTVDRAAAELAAEVRAGRVPTTLPSDAAFDGSDGRLAQTYQEAWLACRLLAGRLGLAGLARFYQDVGTRLAGPRRTTAAGSGAGDPAAAVAAALRADAGTGWSAFVADWRAYLSAVLGAPPGRARGD